MSALGERVLFAHLTNAESVEYLAHEGLDPALIPTEALRPVYTFVLNYFFEGGRVQAPTEEAIRTEYGDVLDDNEITLGDPEDSIAWAVSDLRGSWLYAWAVGFNKDFSQEMASAAVADRPKVVAEYSTRLAQAVVTLERRDASVDLRQGIDDALLAYERRQAARGSILGIRFGVGEQDPTGGLPDPIPGEIDAYTGGIHPGELAVLAGGPKSGKSLWMAMVALAEWRVGGKPVLFTLENSVEMTLDRIACFATHTSLSRWSRGMCDEREVQRVHAWKDRVKESPNPLWVLQPEMGQRSIEALVRTAQLHGATSLLIDQLTFVELPDPRKPKTERIGEALHTLKTMISTSRDRLPCVLAHQVSRDGVKAANSVGYLEMFHMAESAEVERTADWVFGLYRSIAEAATNMGKFQTLAARRAALRSWIITWDVDRGSVGTSVEFRPGVTRTQENQ